MVTTLQLSVQLHTHTHRMPLSAARILMCDPAMRRKRQPVNGESRRKVRLERKAYKQSSVSLPQIWGRMNISSPHYLQARRLADIREHLDTTPYYPYCAAVYSFATGEEKCSWSHQLLEDNSQLTYNFPCGCTHPTIEYVSSLPNYFKSTSAALVCPAVSSSGVATTYEVPCNQVFKPPSNPSKRRRKGLSLTDSKTYRRRVRAKYTSTVCSSSMRSLAGGESDQEETASP